MKLLLVDDDNLALEQLKDSCIHAFPGNQILAFSDPMDALKESVNGRIDIAFLDIHMPRMTGLQLARSLKSRDPETKVIFVTAYPQHALDAYSVRASGYLLKPVDEELIKAEVADFIQAYIEEKPKRIQAKCFGNFEIFCDGVPLKFKRSKSKELIAYLIDREGLPIYEEELCDVLFEQNLSSYFRNLVSDIRATLKEVGCEDLFIKKNNTYRIDITKIDCDAYAFNNNDPASARLFRGQYMYQYSWAMFVDD